MKLVGFRQISRFGNEQVVNRPVAQLDLQLPKPAGFPQVSRFMPLFESVSFNFAKL